jgi:indole-3-glycerol phosphate synthase
VSESGISSREDILALKGFNVSAFLVGTALVREKDPAKKLRELMGG